MRLVIADANILGGTPCFEGTRIAVAHIAIQLEAGVSEHDILLDYADLSPDDIKTAQSFRPGLRAKRETHKP